MNTKNLSIGTFLIFAAIFLGFFITNGGSREISMVLFFVGLFLFLAGLVCIFSGILNNKKP
jgi:hypothetical protein